MGSIKNRGFKKKGFDMGKLQLYFRWLYPIRLVHTTAYLSISISDNRETQRVKLSPPLLNYITNVMAGSPYRPWGI